MEQESLNEYVKTLLKKTRDFIKDTAKHLSAARLLAENEPFGDLVMLSLCDDSLPQTGVWPYLKIIVAWLEETDERYRKQFSDDFPKKDRCYDLAVKPPGFK